MPDRSMYVLMSPLLLFLYVHTTLYSLMTEFGVIYYDFSEYFTIYCWLL